MVETWNQLINGCWKTWWFVIITLINICSTFIFIYFTFILTHEDADRDKLAMSNGKYAQYLCKILDVYFSYHHDAYSTKGWLVGWLVYWNGWCNSKHWKNNNHGLTDGRFNHGAGVYLHDPTALLAAVNPSLLTYTEGVVRVQTSGITRGLTILYNKQKRWPFYLFEIKEKLDSVWFLLHLEVQLISLN